MVTNTPTVFVRRPATASVSWKPSSNVQSSTQQRNTALSDRTRTDRDSCTWMHGPVYPAGRLWRVEPGVPLSGGWAVACWNRSQTRRALLIHPIFSEGRDATEAFHVGARACFPKRALPACRRRGKCEKKQRFCPRCLAGGDHRSVARKEGKPEHRRRLQHPVQWMADEVIHFPFQLTNS